MSFYTCKFKYKIITTIYCIESINFRLHINKLVYIDNYYNI